jgi:hypothetical protein
MDKIDITILTDKEKQALVCMFLATLPKSDPRYTQRTAWWSILGGRYNRKVNTYKNDKDAFDPYFPNNGRVGHLDRPLEKRSKVLKKVFDEYSAETDAVLEAATLEIISACAEENLAASFVALRVQKPDQAHALISPENTVFTIEDVYTLQSSMTLNRIVFVALGGDAGLATVDWARGFYAVGHIIKEPYDIGYKTAGRGTSYYKADLQIDWRCNEPMSKDELMAYPDTYDAPYIGLEIHRDPTQAVCQLEDKKAIAIIRAVLDKEPSALETLKGVFSPEFMERATGATKRIVPISVDFGQTLKDAMEEAILEASNTATNSEQEECVERVLGGKNIIFYGVPGCGKSHKIKNEYCNDEQYMERVVFHPDYTNADFIGQILPVTTDGHVSYDFKPGPFTRILKSAVNDPANYYYLIVEEINRGNAPAIFGEVFQLLDRSNGESEYGVSNADIAKEVYGKPEKKVKIPSNLYILATMNTADQNVFTLDTAFKRRWSMESIPNDFSECWLGSEPICGSQITWESFATTINKKIIEFRTGSIGNEDMRLGAYFVKAEELQDDKAFAEKVLMYLWNDAFKYEQNKIFAEDIISLDVLLEEFATSRKFGVFKPDIAFPICTPAEELPASNESEGVEDA